MENGRGFGGWVHPCFVSRCHPIDAAQGAGVSSSPSSSRYPFPDQELVVSTVGTTSSSSTGGDQLIKQKQQQQQQGHHHHHHHHHLTCLKLGKRQYYGEDDQLGGRVGSAVNKRERASTVSSVGVIPRCQVEGCSKTLMDAKDYYRRHKVCEMHSKEPKVIVLGTEQRFCQQCSRFHAISEFDDSKRSCRRRLAGHNERRRKSSTDSIIKNPAATLETTIIGSTFPYSPGRALSLLSSKASPWIPTPEFSSLSGAALRELIAENRGALLARQLFSNRGWQNIGYSNQSFISFAPHENHNTALGTAQLLNDWNQFQESGSHLTLDLMQSPNSTSFEFLTGRNKSKEEEEECCEIWKSLEGTHVV